MCLCKVGAATEDYLFACVFVDKHILSLQNLVMFLKNDGKLSIKPKDRFLLISYLRALNSHDQRVLFSPLNHAFAHLLANQLAEYYGKIDKH